MPVKAATTRGCLKWRNISITLNDPPGQFLQTWNGLFATVIPGSLSGSPPRRCWTPTRQRNSDDHYAAGYCLSYTVVLLNFLPWALVPRAVTVRLLPSSDATILPVVVTFVPFFTAKSNS